MTDELEKKEEMFIGVTKNFGVNKKRGFEVSIWIDGKNFGKASGKSKKLAQQAAAKIAIAKLSEEEN